MRREHIVDGWWEMPGEPVPALGWPGTKNGESHRVWLPKAAQAVIAELTDDGVTSGFVFAGPRGGPIHGLDGAMRGDLRQARRRACDAARFAAHPRQHHHGAGLRPRRDEPDPEPQGGRHRQRLRPARLRRGDEARNGGGGSQDHGAGGGPVRLAARWCHSVELVRRRFKFYNSQDLTRSPTLAGAFRARPAGQTFYALGHSN